jgi:peptidoglycan hydrolase-like protein with peptidoglycan-binding domain
MKKNLIVDVLEKQRILNLHENAGYKSNLLNESYSDKVKSIQKALLNNGINLGKSGPNKDGVDGNYGDMTKKAVETFQRKNRLKDDGAVGPCTAKSLGVDPLVGSGPCKDPNVKLVKVKTDSSKTTDKLKIDNQKEPYDCIAVTKDTCSKISPSSETTIGQGASTEGCTAYVRKCLSQYDKQLYAGQGAWFTAKELLNSGGKQKYNMYTDGSVNHLDFDQKNITKIECDFHSSTGLHRDHKNPRIKEIITDMMPSSSSVPLSSLRLGDIVGIYYPTSSNMGKAFCQRALENNLFQNGNFKFSGKPFTFNTHVGFVGAIKDGNPLIFHNVEGKYLSTPADKMTSNNRKGMISWVISDPDISKKMPNYVKPEEKSWLDKIKDWF